jgi:hypothetical protein
MLYEGMLPPFRDDEAVVLDQIDALFDWEPGAHSGDQTPGDEDLERVLPFVRAGRAGGAAIRGSEHTDRPVIDVDVFARTRAEAKQIAQRIEQMLLAAQHPIDDVNVLMGPQRVPWVEGVPIVRMYASYQVSLRR